MTTTTNYISSFRLILTTLLVFQFLITLSAQSENAVPTVTLEQCHQWARENYPLIERLNLIDKLTGYQVDNIGTHNLPKFSVKGQATYQSDVTGLPIDLPNIEIPTLNKDQYKIYGEVYQPLTQFGQVERSKKNVKQKGEIEKQQVEVQLYQLKERVNQLYFGTLLIDDKIGQLDIIQKDIDSTIYRIESGIENGTATITDKQLLQVEKISLDNQKTHLLADKNAFILMLSQLTGKPFTTQTEFMEPESIFPSEEIMRPELKLFDLREKMIDLEYSERSKDLTPQLGLFAQGGYGRPALNFLKNDFDFYYIGGIKLDWNLSALYTQKRNLKSLSLSKETIRIERETFLLNNALTQSQQTTELEKYSQLLDNDESIIGLRESVLSTAKVQLENGLITTIDYVKILNDLSQAKQTQLLHRTQQLLAQYSLLNTKGN